MAKYYRPSEYAKLWGVHINTVYFWIKNKYLPGVKSVKVSVRRHHFIPIGVVPPLLFPGPKPSERRVDPPEDMPPWEGPEKSPVHLPEGVSMEDFLRENQISIDQINDDDWEVKVRQAMAIQAEIGSEVK